jgi:hypothetical protein
MRGRPSSREAMTSRSNCRSTLPTSSRHPRAAAGIECPRPKARVYNSIADNMRVARQILDDVTAASDDLGTASAEAPACDPGGCAGVTPVRVKYDPGAFSNRDHRGG